MNNEFSDRHVENHVPCVLKHDKQLAARYILDNRSENMRTQQLMHVITSANMHKTLNPIQMKWDYDVNSFYDDQIYANEDKLGYQIGVRSGEFVFKQKDEKTKKFQTISQNDKITIIKENFRNNFPPNKIKDLTPELQSLIYCVANNLKAVSENATGFGSIYFGIDGASPNNYSKIQRIRLVHSDGPVIPKVHSDVQWHAAILGAKSEDSRYVKTYPQNEYLRETTLVEKGADDYAHYSRGHICKIPDIPTQDTIDGIIKLVTLAKTKPTKRMQNWEVMMGIRIMINNGKLNERFSQELAYAKLYGTLAVNDVDNSVLINQCRRLLQTYRQQKIYNDHRLQSLYKIGAWMGTAVALRTFLNRENKDKFDKDRDQLQIIYQKGVENLREAQELMSCHFWPYINDKISNLRNINLIETITSERKEREIVEKIVIDSEQVWWNLEKSIVPKDKIEAMETAIENFNKPADADDLDNIAPFILIEAYKKFEHSLLEV